MKRGTFAMIAGPAGVGKTTLMPLLLERLPKATAMISTTTRPPRPGEIDGVHYRFMSRPDFEAGVAAGHFIESAEYAGHLYGTDARELMRLLERTPLVIKILEVQGVRLARKMVPGSVAVFLMPEEIGQIERRLRARPGATEADIQARLEIARTEIAAASEFDCAPLNREGKQEVCADEIAAFLRRIRPDAA